MLNRPNSFSCLLYNNVCFNLLAILVVLWWSCFEIIAALLLVQWNKWLATITTGMHCCVTTCCPPGPKVLSLEMLYCYMGFHPLCRTSHFSFSSFMILSLRCSSNSLRFLWMVVLPSNVWISSFRLMLPANLQLHIGAVIAINNFFFFFASIKILQQHIHHRVSEFGTSMLVWLLCCCELFPLPPCYSVKGKNETIQWKRIRTVQVKTKSNNGEREAGGIKWYILKPSFEASQQHCVRWMGHC